VSGVRRAHGAASHRPARQAVLSGSDGRLIDDYDALLVDLDGVVYLGDEPIDGAAAALNAAGGAEVNVVFLTNNAARTPEEIADQLQAMGVPATTGQVMTSAIAAARVLAARLPANAAVLVVGGAGITAALSSVGLRPVERAEEDPVAVLQGFAEDVGWRSLAEASVALRAGALWLATNADATLPSPRGPLPGNGSLVAALTTATGLTPEVIGKPEPAVFRAAVEKAGGDRPLVVGDRLDTDIAGARNAGLPSLAVLGGVSSAADLLAATPGARPTYLGRDIGGLELTHPRAVVRGDSATCGGARATVAGNAVTVDATAAPATPDGLDGLRALCALAWSAVLRGVDDRPETFATALASLGER
jgi:glycerol-1-phosphatase